MRAEEPVYPSPLGIDGVATKRIEEANRKDRLYTSYFDGVNIFSELYEYLQTMQDCIVYKCL